MTNQAAKKCKRMLGRRRWTLDAGRWTLDAGRWTLDAGRWTLDAGRWTLDAGRWTLDDFCLLPSPVKRSERFLLHASAFQLPAPNAASVLWFKPQQPSPRLTRHGVFRCTAALFPYPA